MSNSVAKYRVELVTESENSYNIPPLTCHTSDMAYAAIKELFRVNSWHNEKFGMLCLDLNNTLIGAHIVTEGTMGHLLISNREVIVRALLNNAVKIIIFHNHPNISIASPSVEDIATTSKLKIAMEPLDLVMYDHLILCADNYFSFYKEGLLTG